MGSQSKTTQIKANKAKQSERKEPKPNTCGTYRIEPNRTEPNRTEPNRTKSRPASPQLLRQGGRTAGRQQEGQIHRKSCRNSRETNHSATNSSPAICSSETAQQQRVVLHQTVSPVIDCPVTGIPVIDCPVTCIPVCRLSRNRYSRNRLSRNRHSRNRLSRSRYSRHRLSRNKYSRTRLSRNRYSRK